MRPSLLLLFITFGIQANAQSFPTDPSDFADINSLLTGETANVFVRTIGIFAGHRPYRPAAPLGTNPGLDLGIEVTLIKLPESFFEALETAGLQVGTPPASVPTGKIHFHKGLGGSVDFGLSFIGYQGIFCAGGDIQINLSNPTEGLAWAMRFNYTYSSLGFVKVRTYTPELLVSKAMDYTEIYLGAGYQYASGKIIVEIDLPQPIGPQSLTGEGKGGGFVSFLGLGIKLGPTGLKLTLEGDYSSLGMHTLGAKFGFQF